MEDGRTAVPGKGAVRQTRSTRHTERAVLGTQSAWTAEILKPQYQQCQTERAQTPTAGFRLTQPSVRTSWAFSAEGERAPYRLELPFLRAHFLPCGQG